MSSEEIEKGRQQEIADKEREAGLSRDREVGTVPPPVRAIYDTVLKRAQCIDCADSYFERPRCSNCGARAKSFRSYGRPHKGCKGSFVRRRATEDVVVLEVEAGARCSTCKAVL